MARLVAVYFSGTGNTEYVVERLVSRLEYDSKVVYSIEDEVLFDEILSSADDIIVAYPIVGGNIPIIMREFLRRYESKMWGKSLITIVTEAGFSGDGGALAYRLLATDKIMYKASYHIIMPTNVSFGRLFKVKNGDALDRRISHANAKIDGIARDMNNGVYKKVGSSKLSYILGYHLQRKHFDAIEPELRKKFSVDNTECVQCGKCIRLCPMHNISLEHGRIVGNDRCTLCYRCIHACPTNAITLLHREEVQYKGVKRGL